MSDLETTWGPINVIRVWTIGSNAFSGPEHEQLDSYGLQL
jgi:hypothetical protein